VDKIEGHDDKTITGSCTRRWGECNICKANVFARGKYHIKNSLAISYT